MQESVTFGFIPARRRDNQTAHASGYFVAPLRLARSISR